MRRAIPVIIATAVGLGLLFRFHTSPQPSLAATPFTLPTAPDSSTSTLLPSTSVQPTEPSVPTGPEPTDTAACVSTSGGEVVVDGPTDQNNYGDVKVRVHVVDGKIT
jgi:hypothetical protein